MNKLQTGLLAFATILTASIGSSTGFMTPANAQTPRPGFVIEGLPSSAGSSVSIALAPPAPLQAMTPVVHADSIPLPPVRKMSDKDPLAPLPESAPEIKINQVDIEPIKPAAQPKIQLAAGTQQVDCIAAAIHHEARGEPREGQIAVAEVIIARVKSGKFASTPCGVVKQRNQFSFVRGGVIPAVPYIQMAKMRDLATSVLKGRASSRVKGAMFFHATRIKGGWNRRLTGRIGRHAFYA